MSAEFNHLALTQIRETILRLQGPVGDLTELLTLLSGPLDIIGLLPPAFRRFTQIDIQPATKEIFQISKYVPSIQSAILEEIAPTWEANLQEQQLDQILYQYFCPALFFSSTHEAGDVAFHAYLTLTSSPVRKFSVEALRRLATHYPLDRIHSTVFDKKSTVSAHRRPIAWEDAVRSIVSVPSKVSNFCESTDIPHELQNHEYYSSLCTRFEILISSYSLQSDYDSVTTLTLLTTKLINIGLFPDTTTLAPSQTSFLSITLPAIRTRIASLPNERRDAYAGTLQEIFSSLPSSLFSKVLASLVAHAAELPDNLEASDIARGLVKREAILLSRALGILEGEEDEKWTSISATLLTRTWCITKARILVSWASVSDEHAVPPRAKETLVARIMEIWTSEEHIKHSLLSHHQYLTTALLLAINALPQANASVQSLAFSAGFIGAISLYISHLDPAVRRCGMLAAELVAHRTDKQLDFEQWEGKGEGQEWARAVRFLVLKRDTDVTEAEANILRLEIADGVHAAASDVRSGSIVQPRVQLNQTEYDSDDSLEGYAPSPTSSRSPSPTPSDLDELEKDPTIHIGQTKIQRPVYLIDLALLITSSKKPDDPQNADRIEMALNCAEELIRRKKGFGFELEENAVNLVYAFTGLQNSYELEGFDKKRQDAVSALVACCPRKACPAIIDEFFKNQYSTDQRFIMLNALALGARELASLPIPPSTVPAVRTTFPSKQLPATLHKKYIAYEKNANDNQIQKMLDDISRAAIESGKNAADAKITPFVRERQLRIKQPDRISEVKTGATYVPKQSTFTEVAAECFIGPLLGKFWLFLRDEQARENRSAYRTTGYRGTGTGLILSPLILAQFLGTLAILIHAARHSPAFLAVLAPDTLELAVTLGTKPMSSSEEDKEREAAVLTAALELSVIILNECLEIDGGRSLCIEHTSLLLGTGDWAGEVLNALDRGAHVQGGGGAREIRLRRAAAGVVLKTDELSSRWRQSMISTY